MLNRRIVIADVGCRWGFAEDFSADAESFTLFGFDPDDEECQRLNARYSSPNITAVPIALGNNNGEKTLYLTSNPACSSVYQPDPWLNSNYAAFHCQIETGKTTIRVRRLDDWAKENGLDVIDYMKVDTQGSDFDVLQGAGDLLTHMRCVQVEVMFNPMYLGQPLFADIDAFLRSKGFVLWRFSEVTHYSKNKNAASPINTDMIKHDDWNTQTTLVYAGQIFWGNAYFINTSVFSTPLQSAQRQRDEILFSTLGLPDVLGDQQSWDATVSMRAGKHQQRALASLNTLEAALERALHAEAQVAKAEMDLRQTINQLDAIHASTSWRVTAPLRYVGRCIHESDREKKRSQEQRYEFNSQLKALVIKILRRITSFVVTRPAWRSRLEAMAHRFGVYAKLRSIYFKLHGKPPPTTALISHQNIASINLSHRAQEIHQQLKTAILKKQVH